MCFGGKSSTSTSKVEIPPEVLARYNSVNATADNAAATPFQSYSSNSNDFVAGLNSTQQKGISDISGSGGVASLGDLNTEKYFNPFVKDVANSTMNLLTQQNEQEMSGQKGNAVLGGANFGDRSGVAAANLARQQQLGSASALSQILSQGYSQAQDTAKQQQGADLSARQADLARQAGVGQAELAAGSVQQGTDQAGKTALYNQFQQQRAYPFQTAQFLANIAEGTGALSGSTTTATKPAGFFSGFADGGSVEPRVGLAAGGPSGFDPNAGAYGLAAGSPGVMGYVPSAKLPVGHLMTSEAQTTDETTGADVLNAAKSIESVAKEGPDDWKKISSLFSPKTIYASGGRVGLASGGLPYDNTGYVPDNTPDKAPKLATAKTQDDSGGGGLGDVISAASKIIPFFLKNGGRVGLDTGGLPDDNKNYALDGDLLSRLFMDPNSVSNSTPRNLTPERLSSMVSSARGTSQENQNSSLDGDKLSPRSMDPNIASNPTPVDVTAQDAAFAKGAPTNGSWENWLQHQASKLGLTEDKPVEQIRKEAYGDVVPNSFSPEAIKSSSLAAVIPEAPKASGVATPASASIDSIQPPPAPAQIDPPVTQTSEFGNLLDANGHLNSDYQNAPMIGAPKKPGISAANLDNSTNAVPIPAPSKNQNSSIAAPKTMMQVGYPKSEGNAFKTYSETAINHEGLAIDRTQRKKPPTLAGFDASFYGKPLDQIGPRDIAVAQKRWYDQQGGDELSKKYGPNFAAAYVNLSMLNPNITEKALEKSGGNQKEFFDIVSSKLNGIASKKVAQGLPDYNPGWQRRVADNAKVASGGGGSGGSGASSGDSQVASSDTPSSTGLAKGSSPSISPAAGGAPAPTGLAAAGEFFDRNKSTILPILTGLGAMASSPSRYFGTALLQGVGAGANAYQQYPMLQAQIAAKQAEATRANQTIVQSDIYKNAAGQTMVQTKDFGEMPYSVWLQKGNPTTKNQPDNETNTPYPGMDSNSQENGAAGSNAAGAFSKLSPEMQNLAKQNLQNVLPQMNPDDPKNDNIANNPFDVAAADGSTFRASSSGTKYMVDELSGADPKNSGPIATNYILPFAKNIDSAAAALGLGDLGSQFVDALGKGDDVARNDIISKIQKQRAELNRKGVSNAELDTVISMNPSLANTRQGQAQLSAGIMANEIKGIKKDNTFNAYREGVTSSGFGNLSQYSGRGLDAQFEKEEGPKFQRNKAILADLFATPYGGPDATPTAGGQPESVLSYLIHHGGSSNPELVKALSDRYDKKYGKNSIEDLLNYFGGQENGQ